MRIVEVVLSLDIGGQERLVVRLAQAFHELGHVVDVVTLSPGGALRSELGKIPVHDVVRKEGFDPTLWLRLHKLFRELRPDVVHTHNAVPLEFAAPAAKLARIRTVHTKHGDFQYPKRALQLARGATKFVDRFVAVSTETAEAARRMERPNERKLSVVENGIPLARFGEDHRQSIRAELGIPNDALVVGSVGRLVNEKDYPLLVRAMAPLLGERVRLVIVGEGIARPDIEKAIGDDIRPFVTLTGARRDIPRVLSAFDLFASSSRTEGLPLALPEAMASRLPIVATRVGGVPGIVPPETGLLVPHGDEEALRTAIRSLLDDDARRRGMGESARKYALGRFAEERMLDAYLALYGKSEP